MMAGGMISVYPCSRVCTSTMKLIRARSMRAAQFLRTTNRLPVNLAALAKSRPPSSVPSSQCSLGGKFRAGFSPQNLSMRLSFSSRPTGTSSWGILGMVSRKSLVFVSTSLSSPSKTLIRFETEAICSNSSEASSLLRFFRATSAEALFRRLLSSSTSWSRDLRWTSIAKKDSRSMVESRLLSADLT